MTATDTWLELCATCDGEGLLPDSLCPDCEGDGYLPHDCGQSAAH